MPNSKHTGKEAASDASDVMRDGRTAADSKSAAGSALSQADKTSGKSTGETAAHKASENLHSDDTGDKTRTSSASALSQKEGGKKK